MWTYDCICYSDRRETYGQTNLAAHRQRIHCPRTVTKWHGCGMFLWHPVRPMQDFARVVRGPPLQERQKKWETVRHELRRKCARCSAHARAHGAGGFTQSQECDIGRRQRQPRCGELCSSLCGHLLMLKPPLLTVSAWTKPGSPCPCRSWRRRSPAPPAPTGRRRRRRRAPPAPRCPRQHGPRRRSSRGS